MSDEETFDLATTDVPKFLSLVNQNCQLNLSQQQLSHSAKQLHDQWFTYALELKCADQQAFQFLDLPPALSQAILRTLGALGTATTMKMKKPAGGSLPLPVSDASNYSGTLSNLDTSGVYDEAKSPSAGEGAENSKGPSLGEEKHENLDDYQLTAEMLVDDEESSTSASEDSSPSNSRAEKPRKAKANGAGKEKGDSLMALKRAVDAICSGSSHDDRQVRSLQSIIKQAMQRSGKFTQGVLREHLKRLGTLGSSNAGLEEKIAEDFSGLAVNEEKSASGPTCGICKKPSEKFFALDCSHVFCGLCIKNHINDCVGQQRVVGLKCPVESCNAEISTANIQSLLSQDEFEQYLQATLMAFIQQDDNTFQCPNQACKALISVEPPQAAQPPFPMTEKDDEGRPLSNEAWLHFRESRVRCRECQLIFCAQCKNSPYHKGFTCSQFRDYQAARHCRFCSAKLDDSNTWKDGKSPALRDICTDSECVEKAELACDKMLACGCPCGGVRDEATCLPCLKHELDCDEEYCPICYVDALGSAPAIRLTGPCTHVFHFACVRSKLEAKWPGARISFEFRSCPLCKQNMQHSALDTILAPILALEKEIVGKALARLTYEGRDKDPAIINKAGEYFNDPVRFSMKQYIFHVCFKCTKPYFAGGYACQEASQAFDPSELICPSCQPQSVEDCQVHGKDWLAYKCKFCCSVGSWYCWGNTHFCDKCHKTGVWQNLAIFRSGKNKRKLWEYDNCPSLEPLVKAIGKEGGLSEDQKNEKIGKLLSDPKKCPLNCQHPPAGIEFGLGCSMCEDSHSSADRLKESEAAVREKLSVVKNEIVKSGPKLFKYTADFDQNGLLFYLATCGRTQPYNNPAEAGFVKVTSSGLMGDSAPLSAAVGREVVRCVTAPVKNSWFSFELLEFSLCLTHYTLRHYNSWDTEALRHWVLEASNDGRTWETLCVHVNDQSLNKKGASRTWMVDSHGRRFRTFRILQNGRNSNSNYYLAISGLELYGTLFIQDPSDLQPPANAHAPMPLQAPMPGVSQPRQLPPGDGFIRSCVFQQDFDQNGLMFWLGTKFGQAKQWANPAELGLVRVSCSELASQPASAPTSAVVGREVVRCVSASLANMWFVIDLTPSGKRIRPTHYTLRHYSSWDLEALRNWRFEASINGSEWFVLSVHVNDAALDKKGASHTWALPNCQGAFGFFRVWQTGFNSNNHHYLALSGFEIYGDIFETSQFSAPQFAPIMAPPPFQPAPALPFNPSDPSLVQFRYSYDFDQGGLFFWLGSAGKTQPWQNPGALGLVNCQCSALAVNPPSAPASAIVGREVVRCVSLPKPDMWFLVDLKEKSFFLTHYTLRHYNSWDTEALRHWRLEASNDGARWEILRTHVNDAALNKKGATHTWQVAAPQNRMFRMFRIYQFGPNSNNNHYLALSGMEFYGALQQNGQVNNLQQPIMAAGPALPPPPAYPGPPQQRPAALSVVAPVKPSHLFEEFKEGKEFVFRHDFDENGILFWLGSNQYRQPWRNPGEAGVVRVTSAPLAVNPPSEPAESIVGRSLIRCVTLPNREAFFQVDFVNWWIKPTHYSLKHYETHDTEALRDWKLQGSNDGSKWTKLMSHKKDETLNARGATGTWAIPKCKKSYRMFRVLLAGKNSNGHYYCALSGIEFYGNVYSFKC